MMLQTVPLQATGKLPFVLRRRFEFAGALGDEPDSDAEFTALAQNLFEDVCRDDACTGGCETMSFFQ